MAGKGQKNIIGINKSYEWSENGIDKFYLIMEWMDAGDLSSMLKTIPGQFSEKAFEEMFERFDESKNGTIEKDEMKSLI